MKHDKETIKKALKDYRAGIGAKNICDTYCISKSTLFAWISKNNIKTMRENKMLKTTKQFISLELKYKKLLIEKSIIEDAFNELNLPLEEKLKVAEKLLPKYPLKEIARILNMSGSTFFHYVHHRVKHTLIQKTDEFLKPIIKQYFYDSKERLSAEKITKIIQSQNIKCSKRRVVRLMKEMDLHTTRRKRRRTEKKDKPTTFPIFNKLKQEFNQPAPNRFWSGDVTMVKIKGNKYYVSIIIDLFSRMVISHHLSTRNDELLAITALKKAYENRNCPNGVTFHSDQGTPYKSGKFINLLYTLKISQSFSKHGTPFDNSPIEAFFSNMKQNDLNNKTFEFFDDLKNAVDDYVNYYNNLRPHKSLHYKTPQQFEDEYYKKSK
mgnify:FL=1